MMGVHSQLNCRNIGSNSGHQAYVTSNRVANVARYQTFATEYAAGDTMNRAYRL